ncbi:hypothetical protein ACISSW_28815, partial [Escherichia coli]
VGARGGGGKGGVVGGIKIRGGVGVHGGTPDRGGVVRFAGEGRPWNPGAITGGRVWGDIPDNSVQPGAGNGEPVTAEVLAQRQAEEATRRETERRADEVFRKRAQKKLHPRGGKNKSLCRVLPREGGKRAAQQEGKTARG